MPGIMCERPPDITDWRDIFVFPSPCDMTDLIQMKCDTLRIKYFPTLKSDPDLFCSPVLFDPSWLLYFWLESHHLETSRCCWGCTTWTAWRYLYYCGWYHLEMWLTQNFINEQYVTSIIREYIYFISLVSFLLPLSPVGCSLGILGILYSRVQ